MQRSLWLPFGSLHHFHTEINHRITECLEETLRSSNSNNTQIHKHQRAGADMEATVVNLCSEMKWGRVKSLEFGSSTFFCFLGQSSILYEQTSKKPYCVHSSSGGSTEMRTVRPFHKNDAVLYNYLVHESHTEKFIKVSPLHSLNCMFVLPHLQSSNCHDRMLLNQCIKILVKVKGGEVEI